MSNCKICGNPKSNFNLGNKLVCMKCDELLFDLEIECDEENPIDPKTTNTPVKPQVLKKPQPVTKK